MEPKWLTWAKQLQSIAQEGLTYSKDKFDIVRFQQIRDLSVEILKEYTVISNEKIKDLFCNETGYQTPKIDIRGAVFKESGFFPLTDLPPLSEQRNTKKQIEMWFDSKLDKDFFTKFD